MQREPIVLYYNDFDENGAVDPILSYYRDGKQFPFVPRDDLLQQLPNLKKLFPNYEAYANAEMSLILDQFENANELSANYLSTAVYDLQNGELVARELPLMTQVAPVHTIESIDFDRDGDQDLVLGGNQLYNRVKIGEIDANHGVLLENKGNLNFKVISNFKSGLNLKGEVRSCETLEMGGEKYLIFGINNAKAVSYKLENILTQ